jgi:hypothetical protein
MWSKTLLKPHPDIIFPEPNIPQFYHQTLMIWRSLITRLSKSGVLNLLIFLYPQIRLKHYCVPPNQSINYLPIHKLNLYISLAYPNIILMRFTTMGLFQVFIVDFLVRSTAINWLIFSWFEIWRTPCKLFAYAYPRLRTADLSHSFWTH